MRRRQRAPFLDDELASVLHRPVRPHRPEQQILEATGGGVAVRTGVRPMGAHDATRPTARAISIKTMASTFERSRTDLVVGQQKKDGVEAGG